MLSTDWCKQGISATLWAVIDSKFSMVARMSTKFSKPMDKIQPCEGEATTFYVAGKSPLFIKASKERTIALSDKKKLISM